MALPSDWKTRLESWWRLKPGPPACPGCGRSTGNWWQARELLPDPATVALVCPRCGHAQVFLWELLRRELPADWPLPPGHPSRRDPSR